MEDDTNKNQKTVVAFVAGLLVGGLLVWMFSASSDNKKTAEELNQDDVQGEVSDVEKEGDTSAEKNTKVSEKEAVKKVTAPAVVATGRGSITVEDQVSGAVVTLGAVTFPVDSGWIVVHEVSADGSLGNALGASRYGLKEGLIPKTVELLRVTTQGKTYHAVIYNDNGDKVFDKADDVPVTTGGGARIEDAFTTK